MELFNIAKTSNNFGLRIRFPWTGIDHKNPWTQIVTEYSERSFVEGLLAPIFSRRNPIIRRVENPYLWACYVLAYEELCAYSSSSVKEHNVIHATSLRNALNIADVNFDWRRVNRARFGQGVSFATSASYAQKYASDKTVYIIAGIPISKKSWGYYGTKIPSHDADTTVDSRELVYVKYRDSDFYPYYIVE